jgi:hypothetical protein
MLINWLRNLFPNRFPVTHRFRGMRGRPSRSNANTAACIEMLESRQLLTMLAPTSLAGGTTVTDVQIADINGDSKPDLVELNTSATAVSVQLGNGDGTFQAGIASSSGGFSYGMNIADYNKDGKLDIATNNGSSIDILFGIGDGSFQLPSIYAIGANALDMKTADFNNDGFVDIITASVAYGGTSQLLLNSGIGTFPATNNIAISAFGLQVEVGDLNHDGNEDLVETGGFSSGIFLGQGDGTFLRSSATITATSTPKLSDFNHDGTPDLATIVGGQLQVYAGDGAGGFLAPTSYPMVGATRLDVADMDGNGTVDLISNTGQVAFGRGDGTFYTPTIYSTPGYRMALADFNGDGGIDIISTTGLSLSGVSLSLNANNDATVLAGAVALQVTAPTVVDAGVPFAVTVTAVDASGNVVSGFLGTVAVSGATGSQPVSYTFTAADAGTRTMMTATTLFTSGLQTVTATSPFLPAATASVNVTPAAIAKFAVTSQPSTVAGQAMSVTVIVTDVFGNPAPNYQGTVHFTSSDVQAGLPADYTFTNADNGTHVFSVTVKSAGVQTVTATDSVTKALTGVVSTIVTPAATATLSVSGGGGYIGTAIPVAITAHDAYGNLTPSYAGTVHLVSSDLNTMISGDVTLVNGTGSVTATSVTLGARILTATDTVDASVSGTENIVVTPGWAVRFTATPLAATVAGVSQGTTVTAYDAFGNVSTVYTGTVAVSGTDPQAKSYYAFNATDAGVHTIPVVLKTAGTQSVTIQDLINPVVSVTLSGIQVTSAVATSILTTALIGTTAGVSQSFTVTVKDAFGNAATGYRGTLTFSSSDTLAVLPAAYTFAAADAGVHAFSMAFKTSGGQSITVTDAANAGNLAFTNFQKDIPIVAGTVVGLSARAPSNVTASVAFNLVVSAVDAFGNVVSNYRGNIHFTGPSGGGNLLPADYTFTAADNGSHTVSVTLASTGTQTIGFADVLTGSIKGSVSMKVVTSTTSGGGTGGGATGGGGGGGGKKVV